MLTLPGPPLSAAISRIPSPSRSPTSAATSALTTAGSAANAAPGSRSGIDRAPLGQELPDRRAGAGQRRHVVGPGGQEHHGVERPAPQHVGPTSDRRCRSRLLTDGFDALEQPFGAEVARRPRACRPALLDGELELLADLERESARRRSRRRSRPRAASRCGSGGGSGSRPRRAARLHRRSRRCRRPANAPGRTRRRWRPRNRAQTRCSPTVELTRLVDEVARCVEVTDREAEALACSTTRARSVERAARMVAELERVLRQLDQAPRRVTSARARSCAPRWYFGNTTNRASATRADGVRVGSRRAAPATGRSAPIVTWRRRRFELGEEVLRSGIDRQRLRVRLDLAGLPSNDTASSVRYEKPAADETGGQRGLARLGIGGSTTPMPSRSTPPAWP